MRMPLDLSDLSPAGEEAILSRFRDGSIQAFSDVAASVGHCARPVRLVGGSHTVDRRTGEVLATFASAQTPLGVLYRACGNRRAEVCPACSRTYARDTYAYIHAGIAGGKRVPASVVDNPLLFVTLTAPSFGPVHGPRPIPGVGSRSGGRCRPRSTDHPCAHGRSTRCMLAHQSDDPANGAPLCSDCYDWTAAIVWQWWAPELWRRTTIAWRRALAHHLGVKDHQLTTVASLQYAKVAEFQARGLVHFHALLRLDGPHGPGSPSPLTGTLLARILADTTPAIGFDAPPLDPDDSTRHLAWGTQLDVRIVRAGNRTGDPDGPLTPGQVAGYLAKYATKDADGIRGQGSVRPHLVRLRTTCRVLARRARRHDPHSDYQLLGRWGHMLGFRGHFSTKSRQYSVTLGALRRARRRFQILAAEARSRGELLNPDGLEDRLLQDEEETTLVIGAWTYQGTGWPREGDTTLALAAAAKAREYAAHHADVRRRRGPARAEKGEDDELRARD